MPLPLHSGVVLALLCCLGLASARAQEGQDTFFDQEDFYTCEGFLSARAHADSVAARRYADWADGYLTAAAEDGRLRRYAMRTGTEARATAWLAGFCRQQPLESFYAAVVALSEAWRGQAPP